MSLVRRSLLLTAFVGGLAFSATAGAGAFTFGGGERVSGDGKVAREARKLSGFDGVSIAGPFELRLKQSDTPRVELEADGNLLGYVETRVVDGRKGRTLEIAVKRGYNVSSRQALRIEVDLPTLRRVSIAGSGKAELDAFKSESLDFSVAGSGTVLAPRVDTGKLDISIAGSGDVKAGGQAAALDVSIAGSGDVKTGDLLADEVKVSIAGSGDAWVQAVKKLKVSIAGSGDVRYVGNPEVSSSIGGSGSVRRH